LYFYRDKRKLSVKCLFFVRRWQSSSLGMKGPEGCVKQIWTGPHSQLYFHRESQLLSKTIWDTPGRLMTQVTCVEWKVILSKDVETDKQGSWWGSLARLMDCDLAQNRVNVNTWHQSRMNCWCSKPVSVEGGLTAGFLKHQRTVLILEWTQFRHKTSGQFLISIGEGSSTRFLRVV
jgi:hypothetical protein